MKVSIPDRQLRLSLFILLVTFCSGISAAGYTDGHSTGSLTNWTTTGSRSWSETGGEAVPQNMSSIEGFLINDYSCTDDGTFFVTIVGPGNSNSSYGGGVFRYTGTTSFYMVGVFESWTGGTSATNEVRFKKNSSDLSSGYTVVKNNLNFGPYSSKYPLKVVVSGSTFTFWLGSDSLGQVTDSDHGSGSVGYAYSAQFNQFITFDSSAWVDGGGGGGGGGGGSDDYSTWSYSGSVTLNTTNSGGGADVSSNVYNFPVLIRLDPDNFTFFSQTLAGGADIRFAKTDGTHIPYQIERWVDDGSDNDTAEIWVKIDTVYGNNSTQEFTLLWGNEAAADSSDGGAVFPSSNSFLAAYHLSGGASDATGNNSAGTEHDVSDATSIIGKGRSFNGSSSYIYLDDLADRSSGSVSCWLKPTSTFNSSSGTTQGIWGKTTDASNNANLSLRGSDYSQGDGSTGKLQAKIEQYDASAYVASTTSSFTGSTWYYVTFTWGGGTYYMYVNGQSDGSQSYSTQLGNNSSGDEIGRAYYDGSNISGGGPRWFNGVIDEFRIATTNRSAHWIKLCYQNQKDNQTMLTISAVNDYTWDISSSSGIQGGEGTWGSDDFWSVTGSDGTSPEAWPGSEKSATFAGGVTGWYNISISGTQYVDSISFIDSTYNITGGTAVDFGDRADVYVASTKKAFFNTPIVATNGLVKTGAGMLALNGSTAFSGNVTVTEGVFMIGANGTTGAVSGNITLNDSLVFNRSDDYTFSGSVSGTGTVVKWGADTLTVTGDWNYTGGTYLLDGMFCIGSGGTAGGVLGPIDGSIPITINHSDTYICSCTISGSGAFYQSGSGTVTFSEDHTYTGNTTISAGTLQIGNGGGTGSVSNSSNIVNNSALVIDRTGSWTYSGAISGSGTVTKQGEGTLTLSGTNSYTGTTTVSEGSLLISGSTGSGSAVSVASGATFGGNGTVGGTVSVSGTVTPGVDGTGSLAIGDDLSFSAGSNLELDLYGTTAGSGYDRIVQTGGVTLGGNVTITCYLAYGASVNDSFVVISNDGADAISGTFNGLSEGETFVVNYGPDGYTCRVSYVGGDGNDVSIKVTAVGEAVAYPEWSYSQNIFLNTTSTGADVSGNVVNFPVLLRLNPSNFPYFSQTQPGGVDIRFAKSDGSMLPYEIERWADFGGDLDTAEIWVKLDTVFGNNSTQYFKMFWGKSDATDSSDGSAVFDTGNGFAGVWHLGESPDGGTDAMKDATDNANDGTSTGSMTSGDLVGGQIGRGIDFDGSDDALLIPDDATLDITSGITISGWIKPGSVSGYSRIFNKFTDNPNNAPYNVYSLQFDALSHLQGMLYNGSAEYYLESSTALSTGNFYHVVLALEGTTMKLYLNGAQESNTKTFSGSIATTTQAAAIGKAGKSTDYFTGIIDEVTVSKTARTANWIKLCYENQKDGQILVNMEDYSSWGYSKNIVINTDGVISTSNCVDFPLLVRLTAANFNFNQARDSGQDIRFSKSDGQKLVYQIERWDKTNELAELWVRVDTVYHSNSTQYFIMYWGKSAVLSKSNGEAVFDTSSGFKAVYHLDNNAADGSGSIKDQTATWNGSPANMDVSNRVSADIGYGQSFNGSNEYIDLGNVAIHNSVKYVVSMWVKGAQGQNDKRIYAEGSIYSYDPQFCMGTDDNDGTAKAEIYLRNDDGSTELTHDDLPSSDDVFNNTWNHVAWVDTFNGSENAATWYVNGVASGTASGSKNGKSVTNSAIGALIQGTVNYYFNGQIDELRLEKTSRSSDWIKLCYETQKANSTVLVTDSSDAYRPLGIRRYGSLDSVYVGNSRWALRFAENAGGGVKFLADDTGSSNQLDKNMFYLVYNGVHSSDTGTGTLTLLDSSIVFARVRQEKTVAGQPFTFDYTILGSGKLFIRVYALAASALSGGLEFRVANNATDSYRTIVFGKTVDSVSGVAHIDSTTDKFDLILSPFEYWTDADNTTSSSKYAGIKSSTWSCAEGSYLSWEFMIDFAHTSLTDSAVALGYINDYRESDTLGFYAGTPLLDQAWEKHLRGQWGFNEGTGNLVKDMSGNGHTGTISGTAHWTDGKWYTYGDSLGGSDSITVSHSTDFTHGTSTVMGWIKPRVALTPSMSVVKKQSSSGTGFNLLGATGGKVAWRIADGGSSISLPGRNALSAGEWTHVAARMFMLGTQGVMVLYVNGMVDTLLSEDLRSYYETNTDALVIGKNYDGVVDDVRFYLKDLPDEEIRAVALKGFSPANGFYRVRADNNNTLHCRMHGGSNSRYLPVMQIRNYWSNALPTYVYIDGQALTGDEDYYAALDDERNQLTIGFNRVISGDAEIYIDDDFAEGNRTVGPTKKMYWGIEGSSNEYFWVKNTGGTYFGAATDNEFYMNWKMNSDGSTRQGELWRMKSSVSDPYTVIDSAAGDNLIPGSEAYSNFGDIIFNFSNYVSSSFNVNTAFTYAVEESSQVRVRLRVNERIMKNNDSMCVVSRWTLYPTGQFFRYDSLYKMSGAPQDVFVNVYFDDENGVTLSSSSSKIRGQIRYSSGYPDAVMAWLSMKNASGYQATPFTADVIGTYNDAARAGIYYNQQASAPAQWYSTSVQFAHMMDIHSSSMNAASMDSIANGVQCSRFAGRRALSMLTGTLDSTTHGDFSDGVIGGGDGDGDGFNEMEGAYIVGASDNTVRFVLPAHGDTCRYYPAFRITNYTAVNRPEYVFLYSGSDTVALLEGYQFNSYVNQSAQELILQIDSIFCDSVGVYISSDRTLAVKMSTFEARPGSGCDSLFWRTESEHENMGYYIMRRVNPAYLDSVVESYQEDSSEVASESEQDVRWLIKRSRVSYQDTGWVPVNKRIIPGAPSGSSVGPRDYRYVDWEVHNDLMYDYRLIAVDYHQKEEAHGPVSVIPRHVAPAKFMLGLNYPNPFRRMTRIRFALPEKCAVSLCIYTLQGRLVKTVLKPTSKLSADYHTAVWDGTDNTGHKVAAGQYIYRIASRKFVKSKKLLCIR